MARIGNNYQTDVEGTDKQGGGGELLPHMYAEIQAESIELKESKDQKGWDANITFEVIAPEEFQGRKFWAYWNIVHQNGFEHKAYKYGKPMFDRLGRAVGVLIDADTDTDDLLFKAFVAEITVSKGGPDPKGGVYKDKNQIGHFFYSDDNAKEPIPDLGVLEDAPAPTAANDNRPTARQPAPEARQTAPAQRQAAPAAAAGGRQWGSPRR